LKKRPASSSRNSSGKLHDEYGADYILAGPLAERLGAVGSELWICNVTHDVLGDHPEAIYIHEIE
jgi:hypothetical protein